jgi:hypothetical protein
MIIRQRYRAAPSFGTVIPAGHSVCSADTGAIRDARRAGT